MRRSSIRSDAALLALLSVPRWARGRWYVRACRWADDRWWRPESTEDEINTESASTEAA